MNARVLYTGDCTYLFQDQHYNHGNEGYGAQVFDDHVRLLAESGVDTVMVNPNGQRVWYPSRVFPTVFDKYDPNDRSFFKAHALHCDGCPPENLDPYLEEQARFFQTFLDLHAQGIDWVAEMAKAARKYKLTPWITLRMNDLHGTGDQENSYMNHRLYKNHAMRLSGRAPNPRDGVTQYWQGFNYEKPEVRQNMLTLIRELVNDYDYDGLELDWLRNPQCCEAPATQQAIELMIEWTAEIRSITNARAQKTGRPFTLGVRVSANLGIVRSMGIDVPRMAREGLIDFVSPSNFWQTSWNVRHDDLRRQLGERVTIFGVVEDAPNWVRGYSPEFDRQGPRMLSSSYELLRGNAAGKLVLGAQGIEVFNFFCTDSDVWQADRKREGGAKYDGLRQLNDLDFIRGKNKHYAFSTAGAGTWYPPYELPEEFPVSIEPQGRRAFRLPMCGEPAGMKLIVQVVLDRSGPETPDIGIGINGAWPQFNGVATDRLVLPTGIYTHHLPEHRAINFEFDASAIEAGWNEFTVYNNALFYRLITTGQRPADDERAALSVRVVSLEMAVVSPGTEASPGVGDPGQCE